MARARQICWTFIGFILGTILIGCSSSSDEETVKALHTKAQQHMEQHRFSDAFSAYERIVKLRPRDDEAYYQMALLYLRSGKPEDIKAARQALLQVVNLNRSRADAHLQLAQLYFLSGQPVEAGLQADEILAVDPTHSDGHLIKGLSLISDRRLQNGIAELRKAIELNPKNLAAYVELAKAYAQQRNFSEAESVLRDGLKVDAQSVGIWIALGDVLATAGKESEAVKEYRHGLEVDRTNGLLYYRLAALSQKQHHIAEAEALYRQWIEMQPKDVQAHVALAQFYRTLGRLQEAEMSYQQARKVDPSSRFAQEALIGFYLDNHRFQDASVEIDAILKPNPTDIEARILQARLSLDQGDIEKALPLLQDVARKAPKLAIAHLYLGIAWARKQDFAQAISALKEARTLAPNSSDIRTTLAQTYLAQGSLSLAITEAEAAIGLNPQNVSALKTLADAQLLAGDRKRAEALLKDALDLSPSDAVIHLRLGIISRAQRRPAQALAHFEQAYKLNPNLLEALTQMADVLVSEGKVTQARDLVGRQVSMNPQDPKLHNLLGQVLMQGRNFTEAEAAFKKAMVLDETMLSTYANLGDLYVRQGKVEQAIKELETILAKSPRQPGVLTILGILHEQQKNLPRATARYEEALSVDANFAPAANNLAYILIEHGGDKERALAYAETAWKVSPKDPHIADTLGWVYFHREMYAKAASVLKEAVNSLPESPVILYHYGMAQYRNNNNVEAKKSLTKFLTLSPDNPDASKAKAVLAAML
jgi:tetratricopeptide (TPR) repeat protein